MKKIILIAIITILGITNIQANQVEDDRLKFCKEFVIEGFNLIENDKDRKDYQEMIGIYVFGFNKYCKVVFEMEKSLTKECPKYSK